MLQWRTGTFQSLIGTLPWPDWSVAMAPRDANVLPLFEPSVVVTDAAGQSPVAVLLLPVVDELDGVAVALALFDAPFPSLR